IQLAIDRRTQHARVEQHGIGGERSLALDLEPGDLAQALASGRRKAQAPAQRGTGGKQEPALQAPGTGAEMRGQAVAARCRRAGVRIERRQRFQPVLALQGYLDPLALGLQQQAGRLELQGAPRPARQPLPQRLPPPRQEAAGPGRQARTDLAQGRARDGTRHAHCGEAPSSQANTMYAIPGAPVPCRRTTARVVVRLPSGSRARLSILYVPRRTTPPSASASRCPTDAAAAPGRGSPGCATASPRGGCPRSCTSNAASRTPSACSTGRGANAASGCGRPEWTVTWGRRRW